MHDNGPPYTCDVPRIALRRLAVAVGVVGIAVAALMLSRRDVCNPDTYCSGQLDIVWDRNLTEGRYGRYDILVCVDDECVDAEAVGIGWSLGPGTWSLQLGPGHLLYNRGLAFTPGRHSVAFRLTGDDGTVLFDTRREVQFTKDRCHVDICATARLELTSD